MVIEGLCPIRHVVSSLQILQGIAATVYTLWVMECAFLVGLRGLSCEDKASENDRPLIFFLQLIFNSLSFLKSLASNS